MGGIIPLPHLGDLGVVVDDYTQAIVTSIYLGFTQSEQACSDTRRLPSREGNEVALERVVGEEFEVLKLLGTVLAADTCRRPREEPHFANRNLRPMVGDPNDGRTISVGERLEVRPENPFPKCALLGSEVFCPNLAIGVEYRGGGWSPPRFDSIRNDHQIVFSRTLRVAILYYRYLLGRGSQPVMGA